MGLDCYVMKGNRDEVFKDDRLDNLTLVGGLFSGHGNGSFRGGCYEEFVAHLVCASPGFWHLEKDEVIQTDELRIYGYLLREYLEDNGLNDLPDDHRFEWSLPSSRGTYDYRVKEIKDLATLFEVAAEHNCVMESWW